MAPPAGTLRVSRYFAALAVLFAILYSIVAFGSTHKPKLGLDLVGGIRVVFTALTPQGSPPPTGSQMTQARQILENRINGTGVTGATVLVQNGNQLVVEIPNGTETDLVTLGQAAILNFRGVIAPVVTTTCLAPSAEGSSSASPSPGSGSGSGATSGGASSSSSPAASAPSGSAAPSASHSGDAAANRPLGKAPSGSTSGSGTTTAPGTTSAGTPSATPSGSGTASGSPSASPSGSPSAAPATPCLADPFTSAQAPAAARALKGQLATLYKVTTKNPRIWDVLPNAETCPSPGLAAADCRAYSSLSATQKSTINTALQSFDCSAGQTEPDIATGAYFACDAGTNQRTDGAAIVYLLGHVIVKGTQIDSADAQAPSTSGTGDSLHWTVALTLTSSGGDRWSAWTGKYNTGGQDSAVTTQTCSSTAGSECSLFVGFTLNGQVLSAPQTQAVLDINTSVSGNYTQDQAKDLARELDYGKLPVNFRADATEDVSATLGNSQLKAAFLAGGIGLVLVVLYSLLYYRALGLVTVASLIVSAGLTYALLVVLGKQIGFTLDLAGIAGFIVALGITADSFVVFFERLKDEVHEGRSARVAVPRAWIRARRTIISADIVSFLAAAILYFFASADVKGFAFTLGMSTILDLIVVFLFTHPLVSLLSRSAAFGSSRITGLDAVRGTPAPAGRPVRTRKAGSATTGTAVLDEDEVAVRDSDEAVDTARDLAVDEPVGTTAYADDEDDADPTAPPAERRRTTPETGSAAERAAARRARLRKQNGDDNQGDER